jgi:hypothetical protein
MRHKLLVLTMAIFGPLIMFLMLDIFIEKYAVYSYLLLLALSGLSIYDAIALYLKIRYQKIELSKEGIISTQIFCKPKIIPWEKAIRLDSQERCINVISVDGDKIKIPTMIEGLPTLFTKLKEEMLPLTSKRALHGFDKWILAP